MLTHDLRPGMTPSDVKSISTVFALRCDMHQTLLRSWQSSPVSMLCVTEMASPLTVRPHRTCTLVSCLKVSVLKVLSAVKVLSPVRGETLNPKK